MAAESGLWVSWKCHITSTNMALSPPHDDNLQLAPWIVDFSLRILYVQNNQNIDALSLVLMNLLKMYVGK